MTHESSDTPLVSDRLRALVEAACDWEWTTGKHTGQHASAFTQQRSTEEAATAKDALLAAIAALEADRRRLDALDSACCAIDLRFNETPKRCYRWQVDAWGSERVYLRDAIDEQFAAGLKEDRPDGMPFTKAELEAIRHAR